MKLAKSEGCILYSEWLIHLHGVKFEQCLRNREHVPCFYRVIQTRVEVWENEKCFFEFSQTFTSVCITR